MNKKEVIGKNIRELRRKKGKSQGEFGKILGISHAAISDIERGMTKLSVEALIKIADFFGVEVQEIINDNQTPKNLVSFSHGRGAYGMTEEENKKLKKAQNEFRKLAQEKAESEQT